MSVTETSEAKPVLKWSPHPVLQVPSREQLLWLAENHGEKSVIQLYKDREQAIINEKLDPYRFGYEPPNWKKADEHLAACNEILLLGGNRAAKTTYAAKRVIQSALANPRATIWCFSQNQETSVAVQQERVFTYLPAEFKTMGKQKYGYGNISFSLKNGFSGNKLVFPNGSQIVFFTYTQFTKDPSSFEGGEVGSAAPTGENIGIWGDELIPYSLVQTLRFRMATRNAKMIVTFTPIEGYNDTVKHYLIGAKTLESRPAPLLDGEKVPVVQQAMRGKARIVYFHSDGNPYGGYERLAADLKGARREEVLVRAYGVPTKMITSRFPKFSPDVNVVPHESIPFVKNRDAKVTRWLINDPGDVKPMFMTWIGVVESGDWYVYEEFPDISYGQWADVEKGERGAPGEAAKPMGWSIGAYAELIRSIEGNQPCFNRIIDPRYGAAERITKEGSRTIISEFEEEGIFFTPASGMHIEEGLQHIDTLLDWDTNRPVDAKNRPKLYVSDRCQQTIYALAHYTGKYGKDEGTKDPIDNLRYAATFPIEYIDEARSVISGGGSY